eukprot:PhM_4_TR2630/c0_g1_i1/m.87524/K06207/typA, bipA; GTP-binding protein
MQRSLQLLCEFITRNNVRNIAVIAHVDHGKTTLVDEMLKQSGTVSNARNRVMDSKDQEKERGITILAKHTSILVGDNRINIVDTPGHMDFGGEVERALQMVEGFLLLVDAHEGVKPGTRFVLRKALSLKLQPIIVLNKIDMEEANCEKTEEAITDLFLDTVEDVDQLDLKFIYGSGRSGYMNTTPKQGGTMQPLFDAILQHIPAPKAPKNDNHLRMLVGNVDEYTEGTNTKIKVAIGRIFGGEVKPKQIVEVVRGDEHEKGIVKKIELFKGVGRMDTQNAQVGDVALVHIQQPRDKEVPVLIGATVCEEGHVNPWPYVKPDEPSFSLLVTESQASWKGTEVAGRASHLGSIRLRLMREALNNTALRVTDKGAVNGLPCIEIAGRGLLHLGVILEDMRREDYEFELLAPETMTRVVDGEVHEPWERVLFEYKTSETNTVMQLLTAHHAEIGETNPTLGSRVQTETFMAVRLMGDVAQKFVRTTGGDGVVVREPAGLRPMLTGIDIQRTSGALVSVDSGAVTEYALSQAAQHGVYFVQPGDQAYFGQIVGECTKLRNQDMPINVTRTKELVNLRANAADASKRSHGGARTQVMKLEEALTWISKGELVTVTPKSVRMRKLYFDGKTSKPRK